jgi:hypothetical protein
MLVTRLLIADLAKVDRAAREANVGVYAANESSAAGASSSAGDDVVNFVPVRQVCQACGCVCCLFVCEQVARTIDAMLAWQRHAYPVYICACVCSNYLTLQSRTDRDHAGTARCLAARAGS